MARTELREDTARETRKTRLAAINVGRRHPQNTVWSVSSFSVGNGSRMKLTENLLHPTSTDHAVLQKWSNGVNALRAQGLLEFALAGRRRDVD